ncbi:HEPN domain-containing protein [Belliella pelovolcani]|uniref:HEPN domain-containing protein n=1 Tax=Belliella pelovolcani TaxID=529505 RepID=A0A1N7KVN6_9BACT|nr:HEPN domain-containing protein [Belliella pelovolcani]SIS65597.1 HEPN domain-containing protein [Belliella pelovolcani]
MTISNPIAHLPQEKQDEINFILEVIKKEANPMKVILFGSHATGKWVDSTVLHDGITLTYESDYDILVVTNDGNIKHHEVISHIENKCNEELRGITSILVHSLDYINKGLAIGQYFFLRILKEGIVLFDTGEQDFFTPIKLTDTQFKERSIGYFNLWFPMGVDFLIDAKNAFNRGSYRKSLFELHQAAENFYATVMLVFSGYKPTVHNLKKLRKYAKHLNTDLYNLFLTPPNDEEEYHLFEILRKGYIEARYDRNFEVTKVECEKLLSRIESMKNLVERICIEKIS